MLEGWLAELNRLLDEYEKKFGDTDGMPWVNIGVYGTYEMLKAARGRRVYAEYRPEDMIRITFVDPETGEIEVYRDWPS